VRLSKLSFLTIFHFFLFFFSIKPVSLMAVYTIFLDFSLVCFLEPKFLLRFSGCFLLSGKGICIGRGRR